MKLDCALVACNENTHYLDFWPIVKKAWWDIVGIPCILVYVGDTLPDHLKEDPAVRLFKPIDGWPTATQAQIIRLLYPALLQCEGAVVLSDMDILPLQKDWFVEGFAKADSDQFVSLRGIDEGTQQVYMCYVGAIPTVFSTFFSVKTEDDIRHLFRTMSTQLFADGLHGGKGWCLDQQILYTRLKQILALCPDALGGYPWTATISRLDRAKPQEWLQIDDTLKSKLSTKHYIDFHMPPFLRFQDQIQQIVAAATPRPAEL
jgi:hypothetical protein